VRGLRLTVAVILSLWLAVMVPWLGGSSVLASGSANCSEGGQHSRFLAQHAQTTATRQGAKATFEVWNLVQCTNPGPVEISGSSIWSSVEPTDGGAYDILQMGAANCRYPGVCLAGMHYYFAAGLTHTTPGCSAFQDTWPILNSAGSWVSATHTYTVQHRNNEWDLLVDSTTKTAYVEAAVCWTPRKSVWFGESFDYGDQIGGTYADHLTVSGAQYTTTEGGGWVATAFSAANPCNDVPSVAPFYCDVTGIQSFDIWTDR
jgi:hypothetical protein